MYTSDELTIGYHHFISTFSYSSAPFCFGQWWRKCSRVSSCGASLTEGQDCSSREDKAGPQHPHQPGGQCVIGVRLLIVHAKMEISYFLVDTCLIIHKYFCNVALFTYSFIVKIDISKCNQTFWLKALTMGSPLYKLSYFPFYFCMLPSFGLSF